MKKKFCFLVIGFSLISLLSFSFADGRADEEYRSQLYSNILNPLEIATRNYLKAAEQENGLWDRVSGGLLRKANQNDGVLSSFTQFFVGKPSDTRTAGEISADSAHQELLQVQKQVQKEMVRLGLDKEGQRYMEWVIKSTLAKEKDKIEEGMTKINAAIVTTLAAASVPALLFAPVTAAIGSASAVGYLALDAGLDPKETFMDKLAEQGHMIPIAGTLGALGMKYPRVGKILLGGGTALGGYSAGSRLNDSGESSKFAWELRKVATELDAEASELRAKGLSKDADALKADADSLRAGANSVMADSDYQGQMAVVDASLAGLGLFGFIKAIGKPTHPNAPQSKLSEVRARLRAKQAERVRELVKAKTEKQMNTELEAASKKMDQLAEEVSLENEKLATGKELQQAAVGRALQGQEAECLNNPSSYANRDVSTLARTVTAINEELNAKTGQLKAVEQKIETGKCGVTDQVKAEALKAFVEKYKIASELEGVLRQRQKALKEPLIAREKLWGLIEECDGLESALGEYGLALNSSDHARMDLRALLRRSDSFSPQVQIRLLQEFVLQIKQLKNTLQVQARLKETCANGLRPTPAAREAAMRPSTPAAELTPEELQALHRLTELRDAGFKKVKIDYKSSSSWAINRPDGVRSLRNDLAMALESGPEALAEELIRMGRFSSSATKEGVFVTLWSGEGHFAFSFKMPPEAQTRFLQKVEQLK